MQIIVDEVTYVLTVGKVWQIHSVQEGNIYTYSSKIWKVLFGNSPMKPFQKFLLHIAIKLPYTVRAEIFVVLKFHCTHSQITSKCDITFELYRISRFSLIS